MGFIDSLKQFDWVGFIWALLILIPYVDKEVVALIPGLRQVTPGVRPIYVLDLSWSERGRLLALLLVPYVDGELIELGGVEIEDVIADT